VLEDRCQVVSRLTALESLEMCLSRNFQAYSSRESRSTALEALERRIDQNIRLPTSDSPSDRSAARIARARHGAT
jgi:hypothetical protein